MSDAPQATVGDLIEWLSDKPVDLPVWIGDREGDWRITDLICNWTTGDVMLRGDGADE